MCAKVALCRARTPLPPGLARSLDIIDDLRAVAQKTELYDSNIGGNRLRIERTPAVHHNLVTIAPIAKDGIDICRIAIEQDDDGRCLNAVVRRGNGHEEVAYFLERGLHCPPVMGDDAHTRRVKRLDQDK